MTDREKLICAAAEKIGNTIDMLGLKIEAQYRDNRRSIETMQGSINNLIAILKEELKVNGHMTISE